MTDTDATRRLPHRASPWRPAASALLLAGALALGGCASVSLPHHATPAADGTPAVAVAPDPRSVRIDPWERFNRHMFAFNESLDTVLLRPLAEVYQRVLPNWLRTGVDNMFGNIGDAWSAFNLVLQAKPKAALDMGLRVGVNTAFGLLGFIDVADEAGLQRTSVEDFGQTLGKWGVRNGPYLVLPLFGPSTVRDTAGMALDFDHAGPGLVLAEPRDRNSANALRLLNTRVKLLTASRVLDDIALDKYVLLRDAYLARRRNLIYDGDPPDEEESPADAPTAAPAASPVPAPAAAPVPMPAPAASAPQGTGSR